MSGLRHFFPICFVADDCICAYNHGRFYLVNTLNETTTYLHSLEILATERILSRINLLSRLFRTGVRYGRTVDADQVLFVHNKKICNLNLAKPCVKGEHTLERERRPLS